MALGFASALSSAGFEVAHGVVTIGYDDAAVDAGLARTEASVRRGAGMMSKLTLGFGVGLAVAMGEGAKMAMDFDSKMRLIQTSAGASASEVDRMKKSVLGLAQSTPFGPEQLADALYHVESLGLRGAKAMGVLKAGAQGAMVGGADLEATVNALGGAVRTNIRGAQDYAQAMAMMAAAAGAGNMRMEDLVQAMGTGVLPVAKVAGLSLQDVAASLALMTDENVPAEQAMTRFKTSLMMMQNPSAKAAKAMEALGISGESLGATIRGPGGWLAAVQSIQDGYLKLALGAHPTKAALHDLAMGTESGAASALKATHAFQALSQAFGGARGAATIMMLANNVGILGQKYAQTSRIAGQFGANVSAASKTDANQIKTAWSSVQVALIALGHVVLPPLVLLAKVIGEVAAVSLRYSGIVKALGLALGTAAAAWGVYKAIVIGSTLATKAQAIWEARNTAVFTANTAAVEANTAATITWETAQGGALAATVSEGAAVGASTVAIEAETVALGAATAAAALFAAQLVVIVGGAYAIGTALDNIPHSPFKALGNWIGNGWAKALGIGPSGPVSGLYFIGATPVTKAQWAAYHAARDESMAKSKAMNDFYKKHPGQVIGGDPYSFTTTPPPVSPSLDLKYQRARLTKSTEDDVTALKAEVAFYMKILRTKGLTTQQLATVTQSIANLDDQINSIEQSVASKASSAASKKATAERKAAAARKKAAAAKVKALKARVTAMTTVPLDIQLAEAEAGTTKSFNDDVKAYKSEIAWLDKEIKLVKDSNLTVQQKTKALITLYNDLASAQQNLLTARTNAHKKQANVEALLALQDRQGFLAQFGPNIYHRGPGGVLELGAGSMGAPTVQHNTKTVVVNQHFRHEPKSKMQAFHDARYAAQTAL